MRSLLIMYMSFTTCIKEKQKRVKIREYKRTGAVDQLCGVESGFGSFLLLGGKFMARESPPPPWAYATVGGFNAMWKNGCEPFFIITTIALIFLWVDFQNIITATNGLWSLKQCILCESFQHLSTIMMMMTPRSIFILFRVIKNLKRWLPAENSSIAVRYPPT